MARIHCFHVFSSLMHIHMANSTKYPDIHLVTPDVPAISLWVCEYDALWGGEGGP